MEQVRWECPFIRLRDYPGCFEDCPDTDSCQMDKKKSQPVQQGKCSGIGCYKGCCENHTNEAIQAIKAELEDKSIEVDREGGGTEAMVLLTDIEAVLAKRGV